VAFIISAISDSWRRKSTVSDSELYPGVDDFDYNNDANNKRNDTNQGLRWRLPWGQRRQHDSQRRSQFSINDLHRYGFDKTVFSRGDDTQRRNRGADRHHALDYYKQYYKFLIGLLAVICLSPVRAQDGGTTAIANPVATSSGSVSNQAVQINQGSYSQQGYGGGHTCNSSTLVLTPFYLGNDVNNAEAAYIRNQNFGAQVSLSIPLDFEMVRLCKDLAKRKLEKERLDYELVRILKCVEIKKAGYTIHPSSPYAGVCADVVPIAAVQR
jgi:hypothetical protein